MDKNKKKYKVKIDNGVITPLEPIDIDETKEGFVIFFENDQALGERQILSEILASFSEKSLAKVWDNKEDDIYNDL